MERDIMLFNRHYLLLCIMACSIARLCYAPLEILAPEQCNAWDTPRDIYAQQKQASLSAPAELVQASSVIQEDLRGAVKKLNNLEQARKENPIWLLNECLDCPISRLTNPSIRADFDQQVAKTLCEKSKSKRVINYLNFASGGSLQDLIITSKALDGSVKAVNLHLLETANSEYITTLERLYPSKRIPAFLPLKEHDIAVQGRHEIYSQLSHWLKYTYPDATCRIFVHKDAQDYQHFCRRNPELIADVTIGIDFYEDEESITSMTGTYLQLIRYVLKNNRASTAFLLENPGNPTTKVITSPSSEILKSLEQSVAQWNAKNNPQPNWHTYKRSVALATLGVFIAAASYFGYHYLYKRCYLAS